jgi:pimeloyl-ACP methyl ester carboxylesterase
MKLFYRRFGEGPPLIILHGLYGSSDNWVTIAKALSHRFTVFLPDQRNHGNSPHEDIHDYLSMSRDLHEFAADLNLKRFFLAGHSMGGKTAMMFAMNYPEIIECLVIMDISPFTDRTRSTSAYRYHHGILRAMLDTDLSSASRRDEIEMELADKIKEVNVRGFIMKNLQRTENKKFRWKINIAALLNNLKNIVTDLPFPENSADEITGFPVVFLKGENSDHLLNEDYDRIKRLFPAAEIKIIKNAGHWLNADNPEAVIKELENCY